MRSLLLDAPVEKVFGFHERPDALALLSPPFPPVRTTSRTGHGIEAGSRIELRIGFLQWIAHHTVYEKNRLFVDEQLKGPFAKWIHRHEFAAEGHGTRLTDRIEYQLPGGPLVNLVLSPVVNLALSNMFAHRHRVTRKAVAA